MAISICIKIRRKRRPKAFSFLHSKCLTIFDHCDKIPVLQIN
ncbi:predicted protein [Listeria monocytogenes J2818]|nr:predicted protein [Listeria monocytogenes J2818]